MPIIKDIHDSDSRLVIWQIDESEEELHGGVKYVGNLPTNQSRRLEKLAVLNLLNQLDYGYEYYYSAEGRPYLKTEKPDISISHAGNKVVLAASLNKAIGVDIEQTGRNYGRVASRYMTQREISRLGTYGKNEMAFIWCVKEAVYKLPWGESKNFGVDIEVFVDTLLSPKGWSDVKVLHNDVWLNLRASYEYIDDYCLVWVNL